ncbi:MAG: lantibiotic dehydratase [Chloroflexi bacterium]|nr:lantibiotic dehydratase [Chloroflexota bacterium]
MLRTALLPFGDYLDWSRDTSAKRLLASSRSSPAALDHALASDRKLLRARLRDVVSRPEVQEALFLSSPTTYSSLPHWLHSEDRDPKGRRVELALVAYFSRLAGRATPFGLCAGYSLGALSTRSTLHCAATPQRHIRLDIAYVDALIRTLLSAREVRHALAYVRNPSLYRVNGHWRYIQTDVDTDGVKSHRLVSAEPTPYLDLVLRRSCEASSFAELAALVAGSAEDDEPAAVPVAREAAEYIDALIASQLLVSRLALNVTGCGAAELVLDELTRHGVRRDIRNGLTDVLTRLEGLITRSGAVAPNEYRALENRLHALGAPVDPAQLFHVDMVRPDANVRLSTNVAAEVLRAVEVLHRITPVSRERGLERFREAFAERYGDAEVPLVEALDDEVGLGYERPADPPPFLALDKFRKDGEVARQSAKRERLLFGKAQDALNRHAALELTDLDVRALQVRQRPPLPDSFGVLVSLAGPAASDRISHEFGVLLRNAGGPSGVRLLTRFCEGHEALRREVAEHIADEEAWDPEAVFAEVVHLPDPHIANIVHRPVLRKHEIPIVGRAGVSQAQQILLEDLLVSVRDGRVVLRSRRLGRRVVPRLSTAHNYASSGVAVYRFLAAVQQANVRFFLEWSWGDLEVTNHLPRVVHGRTVLARERWRVAATELAHVAQRLDGAGFAALHEWRQERALPDVVVFSENDRELVVDFANILACQTFLKILKRRGVGTLLEMYPSASELCVAGSSGLHVNEVVLPFVRQRSNNRPADRRLSEVREGGAQTHALGSDWLYAKLYCSQSGADRLLRALVGPVVEELRRAGVLQRWFFIRYGDPDWHLRLRFRGESTALMEVGVRAIARLAESLGSSLLWRLQYDTYIPERERYGGPQALVESEALFEADSEAALAVVRSGGLRNEERWLGAMVGIDLLLTDFAVGAEERLALVAQARAVYDARCRVDREFRRTLGALYREKRTDVAEAFRSIDVRAPFERRSIRVDGVVGKLRQWESEGNLARPLGEILGSYIHMHVNRLLRVPAPQHELVVYDFLCRWYAERMRSRG